MNLRTYHAIVTITQNARNLNKNHVRLRPIQQKLPWIAHRQHCLSQPSCDDTTDKTSSLATFNRIIALTSNVAPMPKKTWRASCWQASGLSNCFHTSSARVFGRAHLESPWPGAALGIKSTRQSGRSHLLAPKCFSSPRVYAAQQQDFSAPAKARFLSPAAGRVNYHATRITSEFESTKIRITKSKNKRKKSSPMSWNLLGKKHHYKCMNWKSFRVSEAHLWVGSASSHFHGNYTYKI